jgi:hypothetical protein
MVLWTVKYESSCSSASPLLIGAEPIYADSTIEEAVTAEPYYLM